MNEPTEKPKNENLLVGQNSGPYENSWNNGNTKECHNNSVSSRSIRSMKRSITNTAPTNRSWFHSGAVKPVEKMHSENFHSGNATLPFYMADTSSRDHFYGSPIIKKKRLGFISNNVHHQKIPVDYRFNVPPPPKDDTFIENSGSARNGGVAHVYNGNDGTVGSKYFGYRGTGNPFCNASFRPSTNNVLNVNPGENCKPNIHNDITRNAHTSGKIIYRPPIGFQKQIQQQSFQIGESNNASVRSIKVDENKFAVYGTTIPLCKKGNVPLHISHMPQGNIYNVHRSIQQAPIQMNRNYLTSQPTCYKKMNVYKMHNYGEKKPMNTNSSNTIRNQIQNNVIPYTHSDNKSEAGYHKLKGMTHSFLPGNNVKKRPLQVQGSGYTSLMNTSDRNVHNHCMPKIYNRSNSLVLSRKGHKSNFTNYKDTHQKDNNTNYFNSQKQHYLQGEQNTIITNNGTTSNAEKLQNSSTIAESEALATNENQNIKIVKEKNKTVFCNVCMIHVKSTTYEKHEQTEHVKCPLDNCNEVYNVNDFEYHLLRHVKKKNSNKSILEDPEEIKKWIEERKKNYPRRKNMLNQTSSDEKQQERGGNRVSKKLKKPNCLIEELLFENYCTAIGKHIMHKKKKDKSIFVPLFTQMEKTNYPDMYGKEYYSYFGDSEEAKYTNYLKPQNKNAHCKNSNNKCNKIIESLNIHKTPPLLYQLMRNDILEYEQKLMSCIIYITENNFFDTDDEKDIVELK